MLFVFVFICKTQANEKTEEITITASPIQPILATSQFEFDLRTSNNIIDAISEHSSAQFSSSGDRSQVTQIYLQGLEPDGVAVYVDGIRQNNPSNPTGTVDFSQLSSSDSDRISIFEGTQSMRYGSDSLSGVILIESHPNSESNSAFLEIEAGGTDSRQFGANLRSLNHHVNARLRYSKSSGISSADDSLGNLERDGSENIDSQLTFVIPTASRSMSASISGRFQTSTTEIDDFGGVGGDDPDKITDQRFYSVKADASYRRQDFIVSYADSLSRTSDPGEEEFEFEGNRINAEWNGGLWSGSEGEIQSGIQFERETAKGRSELIFEDQIFQNSFKQVSSNQWGVYTEFEGSFLDSYLDFIAGVRLDSHDRFGEFLSGKVGIGTEIEPTGTRANLLLSNGFKSPTLFQVYDSQFGNPNLDPSRIYRLQVKVTQPLGKSLSISTQYFRNHVFDLIQFNGSSQRNENIGRARTQGLGLSATIKPSKVFVVSSSYFLIESSDLDASLRLARRPIHQLKNRIQFLPNDAFLFYFSANYIGQRFDLLFDNQSFTSKRISLSPYWLLGTGVSYQVNSSITLYSRIANLLNSDYETIAGYSVAGVSGTGGIRASF